MFLFAMTPCFVAASTLPRCKLKSFVANACNYGRVALQAKLSSVAFFKFSFLRGVSVGACADGLPRQDCYEFSERNNLQCPNLFLLFGSVVNVAVHIMGDLAFVKLVSSIAV